MNTSTWNEGVNSDPTSELRCLVNSDHTLETRYLPSCTHKSAKNNLFLPIRMSQLKMQPSSHPHLGSMAISYIYPLCLQQVRPSLLTTTLLRAGICHRPIWVLSL